MKLEMRDVRGAISFGAGMRCAMDKLLDVAVGFPDLRVLSAELTSDQDFRVHLSEDSWMEFASALRAISGDAPVKCRVPDFQNRVGVIFGVERSIQLKKLFKPGTCDPEDEKYYRASITFRDVEYICITTKEVYKQYGLPMPKGERR